MKILYTIFTFLLVIDGLTYADSNHGGGNGILDAVHTISVQRPLLSVREEKQHQKEQLEKIRQSLEESTPLFQERITQVLNEVKTARRTTREGLQYQAEDDAVKKLTILNETYQTFKDIERQRDELKTTIETLSSEITKFLDDIQHESFKKERKLIANVYYSFDDILRIHQMIRENEQRLGHLSEQLKNAQTELKTRERALTVIVSDLKKRQEDLTYMSNTHDQEPIDLLKAEIALYEAKKEYSQLQVDESTYRVELTAFQQFIAKSQLTILKDFLGRIKSSLRINETDVLGAKESLKKLQQEYFARKESYRHAIDELDTQLKIQEAAYEVIRKQYNINPGTDLDDWSREPNQTVESYVGLCKAGLVNSSMLLLKKNKILLDANIALEDEQFSYHMLQAKAKETYFKIIARRFATEEQINQEIKYYETIKATIQASLATYKEKNTQVAEQLNMQKRISDNIHTLRMTIESKRATLFKNVPQEHALCLDVLRRADRKVRETTEVLGKLTGVYSGLLSEINASIRVINFIIGELQSIITIWYRPSYAISWKGFTSIGHDIASFAGELNSYLARFDMKAFIVRVGELLTVPGILFTLLYKLLLIILLSIILYRIIPSIYNRIIHIVLPGRGIVHFFGLLIALSLLYIRTHIILLTFGLIIYNVLSLHIIPDPYIYVLICLMSIAYFSFIIYTFAHQCIRFNEQHNYVLFDVHIQDRYITILSLLGYVSTILIIFRHAFMNIYYYQPDLYHSELPTIISAVNIIFFQISLLLLITKEQILSIIPRYNTITDWLYSFVDNYYYLLFCCVLLVIVMSHPYVGYGRLVMYIVAGIVYTILLCKALLIAHNFFKSGAKYLFFEERDQVIRERFANAKTWFGLSIIASFLLFLSIGIFIGAKIWGWPITLKHAFEWLYEPLLLKASPHPITMISLFMIFGFIVAGFLISYALNRFVLEKIFDLLLVDTGVQNMVTRILRYIIVTAVFCIALQSVGLGGLVTWLIAVLGLSIGWVLKDPMVDIVAYFIILVQRQIKIGDYIRINDQIMGIVRKITPRAVVLRRRNSTTIVVPNAHLITHAIENWNYTRNFIAFDDIYVIVQIHEDPARVKELLMQIVHEHPQVLRNPKAIVRLDDLGNRGFVFMVRGYLSSAYTLDQWDIASDVRIAIVQKFRELDIKLALPIMQIIPQELSEKNNIGPHMQIKPRE
ncbi:MAG TPA: mechanosensitive ion channel domain-containing protein [Candidatus Babeliales bacterium]|jgi:small-conductance mechanosensitive channel|nr:mechanosensitive ion channel domain-containing protein [Candidatus Babeliales bacterium]